jgi:tetratricopeptide (TPR) repeat protein
VTRLLSALLVILSLAGCARALREPRPLDEIAGSPGVPVDRTGALLSKAEALFARRDLPSVREAADAWLEAAAADRTRIDGVIGGVRARLWLADHETEPAARLAAAESAAEAIQWCTRIAPDDPACSYWLGVALGIQARERPATALSALPKMIEAFTRAAAEAPGLDHGGPDRALALLYVRAPAWPGPGDPEKGLEHARTAVAIEGDYPPNLTALAETLFATGSDEEARAAAVRALELARARAASGDKDAPEWIEEAEKSAAGGDAR